MNLTFQVPPLESRGLGVPARDYGFGSSLKPQEVIFSRESFKIVPSCANNDIENFERLARKMGRNLLKHLLLTLTIMVFHLILSIMRCMISTMM